jgi:hypothetical protein
MNRTIVTIVACAAVMMFAGKTQAGPLDDLIEPKAGATTCFARTYDEAHLRRHPKQRTVFIAAWMQYEKIPDSDMLALGFSFAIKRRGEQDALFSQGGCEWDALANRDTSNNRLISAFPRDEAAVCLQSARPDVFEAVSAQEGGSLIVDRGKDKNTLMIYLDDSMLMVKRAKRGDSLDIKFGADDRAFMLWRADAKECTFLEEAVMTPEPGVRDRRQR